MRVLLVSESARPHNGGMNRVVVETCRWLRAAGHDVLLAFSDQGAVEIDCPVHALPPGDAVAAVTALAKSFRPDVVQVHLVPAAAVLPALAAGWPTTVFLHDQTWFCSAGDRADRHFEPCHRPHSPACLFWNYAQGCGGRNPLGNWQRWRRTQSLGVLRQLPQARLQVASRFMRAGLLENGYAPERVDVVPLFAEPPPAAGETEPGLILLPSRLVPAKGVQVALAALAGMTDVPWRLVIAGDGNQRAELESLTRQLGLTERTQFLGEVGPDALGSWYARAQLVLFPVLRREPFGLIGVECLAYGKPIVAFGGGAVEEWLWPGETGLRVDERTPAAFAAAIRTLLLDPKRCRQMSEAARRRYPFFRPSAYVERLVAAFERTIAWHREQRRP